MRKILTECRRRAWVVLLCAILVVGASYAATRTLTRKFSAEAVMVVHANGPLANQPDASTQMASTYATVIPLDPRIQRAVERMVPDTSGASFTTTDDPSTAVLRVVYESPSRADAIIGAIAVAHAVTTPKKITSTITPGTVSVVRLPTKASGSPTTTTDILIAAGVLGLLLGFVLLAFWRPRDLRIDDVGDLRRHLDCPCLKVDGRGGATLDALIESFSAAGVEGPVTVLPVSKRERRSAELLHTMLVGSLGAQGTRLAGVPGSEEAGELVVAGSNALVVVVTPGTRIVVLLRAIDLLARYRADPAFAVLMRASRRHVAAAQSPPSSDAAQQLAPSQTT